jgi:hypothetical protein
MAAKLQTSPSWLEIWLGLTAPSVPGYANTTHAYDASLQQFIRQHRSSAGPDYPIVLGKVLGFATDKYEMFAFGATSVVAPLGATNFTAIPGVFATNRDLRFLPGTAAGATRFTSANTGHSAQFVGDFLHVAPYWQQVARDVQ